MALERNRRKEEEEEEEEEEEVGEMQPVDKITWHARANVARPREITFVETKTSRLSLAVL